MLVLERQDEGVSTGSSYSSEGGNVQPPATRCCLLALASDECEAVGVSRKGRSPFDHNTLEEILCYSWTNFADPLCSDRQLNRLPSGHATAKKIGSELVGMSSERASVHSDWRSEDLSSAKMKKAGVLLHNLDRSPRNGAEEVVLGRLFHRQGDFGSSHLVTLALHLQRHRQYQVLTQLTQPDTWTVLVLFRGQ